MDKLRDVPSKSAPERKQPLKTTVSMPILGHRSAAAEGETRRERRNHNFLKADKKDEQATSAALPDSGDDDDQPRPAGLTKSTSCYYVRPTGGQPTSDDKPSLGRLPDDE